MVAEEENKQGPNDNTDIRICEERSGTPSLVGTPVNVSDLQPDANQMRPSLDGVSGTFTSPSHMVDVEG